MSQKSFFNTIKISCIINTADNFRDKNSNVQPIFTKMRKNRIIETVTFG